MQGKNGNGTWKKLTIMNENEAKFNGPFMLKFKNFDSYIHGDT